MKLGRVVGTVVSTIKSPGLRSYKLLLVSPLAMQAADETVSHQDLFVAIDLIGAGEGDVILACRGSAARVVADVGVVPTDAAIVAIVDTIQIGERTAYAKGE
ncbi:MAG: EutN/CcmL family microcompartment protein [Gammaproteobacteria bacterium]